jgi:threonine dehydrogenase-like Zn-dependent dehydrogenase
VIGGGAIGLLMVQLARLSGAAKVILSEPVELPPQRRAVRWSDLAATRSGGLSARVGRLRQKRRGCGD